MQRYIGMLFCKLQTLRLLHASSGPHLTITPLCFAIEGDFHP